MQASYTDNISHYSSGNTTRLTTYSVNATTGFTLTETVQPGGGTGYTLTTTFGYDAWGNKISASSTGDSQTRADAWSGIVLISRRKWRWRRCVAS